MKSALTHREIETWLLAAKVQPTAQRLAIGRYILCEGDHPTAEDVKNWADVHFPKMSLATVYNTLGTFVESGLLKEVLVSNSEKVHYDCNVSNHFHFLDEKTGRLIDIDPSEVTFEHQLEDKFKIKSVEILIKGEKSWTDY